MLKISISKKSTDVVVTADMLPCLATLASNRESLYLISLNPDRGIFSSLCLRSGAEDDETAPKHLAGKSSEHTAAELEFFIFVPNAAATLSNGEKPNFV